MEQNIQTIEEEVASKLSQLVENPSDQIILDALVAVAKERSRWMRGEQLWRYTSNGPSSAKRHCRLCSASTTWCSKWPRTVRSKDEETEDQQKHIANVRALIARDQ